MSKPIRLAIAAGVALVLAAVSIVNLDRAGQGLARRTLDVDGVPMELFLPARPAEAQLPAVLVVHGFSGNRQLMLWLRYTLA